MSYKILIITIFLVSIIMMIYQTYQHIKGNFEYIKISTRLINIIVMFIIMMICFIAIQSMRYDDLIKVVGG